MSRLGEKDHNAIILRFFENKTPQEVAAALKLNDVTARKSVSRALERLRTLLAKRGVVLTTAMIGGAIQRRLPGDDGAGVFRGQLNDSGTEISGSWTQAGRSLPAIFKRAVYQAEHAHDADKDYFFVSRNDLQGHWKGTWRLKIGKVTVPMRFALDVAKMPDGSYSATMANVDGLGVEAPVPTSNFEYSPPHMHMEWKWAEHMMGGW